MQKQSVSYSLLVIQWAVAKRRLAGFVGRMTNLAEVRMLLSVGDLVVLLFLLTVPLAINGQSGCIQTSVNGASSMLQATKNDMPQTLNCTSGVFPGGFNTQVFVCNVLTGTWVPSPTTTTCATVCPPTAVPGAGNSLPSNAGQNAQSTISCVTGTFPGGLLTQVFTCNAAGGQWVPNPATFSCSSGCPQATVMGATSMLFATTLNTTQNLTCTSGTFPGSLSTQRFMCNTATQAWVPNPAITMCSSTASMVSNCVQSPVYAAGEKQIRQAFCQLLQRCPHNILEWSLKYQNNYYKTQQIVKEIALSDEFYEKNLANSADQVATLYMKLLARPPDPSNDKQQRLRNSIG